MGYDLHLTEEQLTAAPRGSLVEYRCIEDGVIWYEPIEQVLMGGPIDRDGVSESHYCPYCDSHAWPQAIKIVEESD